MTTVCFENATIIHKNYGTGVVLQIRKAKDLVADVAICGEKKVFSVKIIAEGEILHFEQEDLQTKIREYYKHYEKEQQKEQQRMQHIHPTETVLRERYIPKYGNNPPSNTIWLKFEGPQNPNSFANLHEVFFEGKRWYVLHYTKSKKPSNVHENDEFFMAEGITDSRGKSLQVITGRGHLYAFSEENVSPKEWEETYPWIVDRPWYVIIKDFEMLNTQISNCMTLEQVVVHCGTNTYEASCGKDRNFEYVMHMHTQKIHMKLTSIASEYIHAVFDQKAKVFGSKIYYSDI